MGTGLCHPAITVELIPSAREPPLLIIAPANAHTSYKQCLNADGVDAAAGYLMKGAFELAGEIPDRTLRADAGLA